MRAAAALLAVLAAAPAGACEIELVLAMDVSRSVVNKEYDLQMGGLALAFRDAAVIAAIEALPGGIMATVTQWSGPEAQAQSVPWMRVTGAASAARFAAAIEAMERHSYAAFTAIGEALVHAEAVGRANPSPCARRVIDVSGDGASNRGRDPGPVSRALAAQGVTVNALVVLGARPDPLAFYEAHVVAGPGSFLEVADGFEDYPAAIRRKLLRELAPLGLAEAPR